MKVGDLVRFKVHHYHKSYGVGVLIGKNLNFGRIEGNRYWALFSKERTQVSVRLDELETISENR